MVKREVSVDNSFGVASVVLGIVSVGLLSPLSVVFGIIAVVFSMKQKKNDKNKWAFSGLVLGIIGIVLGILATILIVNNTLGYISQFQGA